jgi:RimJ/RimL family protein N-acetyltransferase
MIAGTRSFTVRPAEPEDAAAIVDLLDDVAQEGTLGVPRAPRRPAEERVALASASPLQAAVWVAASAGVIAGHLVVVRGPAPYRDHTADVAVAVSARFRGQGAGGRLLDAAIAWGSDLGLTKICASVLAGNAAALGLFASRGFLEEGVRRDQFRVEGVCRDELCLARFLG